MSRVEYVLRIALAGTGFLFLPLCAATLVWFASFLYLSVDIGLTEASARCWVDAALLKAAWFLGGVRGVYRIRRGCQD